MKIHHLTVADAFASLKSGLAGLSDAEAARRLDEFGANQVEEVAHQSLLLTFAKELAHFFAIILWIAAGLAFFAEWRDPRQGMAPRVCDRRLRRDQWRVIVLAGISRPQR